MRRFAYALLLPLVVACGDRPASDLADRPVQGGTAVVAGSHDLRHMNGLVVDEPNAADLLRSALFLTLVAPDTGIDYVPRLAEGWERDGERVTFRLRRDVFWHDGVPTTAEDVAFTFRRVRDPETASPVAPLFEGWDAVEVVDSFTVRFRVRPRPDDLFAWTELPIAPAHLLDTVPANALRRAAFNRRPVGNGPFRVVSYRENDRWVFEANPEFPEALGGRPHLDRLVWRVIPESSAQVTELRTGNAHLIMAARAIHLRDLVPRPGIRAIVAPSNTYAFIGWNARAAPLDDVRVRRALTLAIDRQEILDALRDGYGSLAVGPIPPGHWAAHPDLAPYPHDPEAARSLLDEAGWQVSGPTGVRTDEAGRSLEIEVMIPAGVDFSRDLAEVVRGHLARVGVGVRTRPLEAATLFGTITAPEKRFQAVILTLGADRALDLRETFHSQAIGQPYQLSSWSTPEADALMDRLAGARTRQEALPLWYRLQEVLHDEQPWTFLYYAPTLLAVSDRLQGVHVDARGTFITLPEWWLAPGPDGVPAREGADDATDEPASAGRP